VRVSEASVRRAAERKVDRLGYLAAMARFRDREGGYTLTAAEAAGIRQRFPTMQADVLVGGVRLATALRKWAQAGFAVVSGETYNERLETCRDCAAWREEARLGLGRCLACDCTRLKLWLATEHCPRRKWPAEALQAPCGSPPSSS